MLPKELSGHPTVDLFQIRFPRLTRKEAVDFLIEQIENRQRLAVCFPDMSTLNLIEKDPKIGRWVENHFVPFNDGAGLELASWVRGSRFPENLTGTDLVPELLKRAPANTKVFLIGSKDEVVQKAREVLEKKYPHLSFSGVHHGFFSSGEELRLGEQIQAIKPDLILVGMGNPLQLAFIHKQVNAMGTAPALWLAVGGLFDFYGGKRVRAPEWIRRLRLEWLHILWIQPHKFVRYSWGIPVFLWNTLVRSILSRHDLDIPK